MRLKTKKMCGFTLLEILIALFVFTIIAMIMSHALRTVFASQAATEARAARLATLQMGTLLLSRDLEQAIDRPITNRDGESEASFIGTANSITFTHGGLANPLGAMQRSTLQRARYSLMNGSLTRTTWQVLDQVAKTQPDHRSLTPHLSQLHFEYIDQQGHRVYQWPPPNPTKISAFPRAVRVVMTLPHWGQLSQLYVIPGNTLGTP